MKINTPYGEIEEQDLSEFCRVAGYRHNQGKWTVLTEEVESWKIVNPVSQSEKNKWQKKPQQLTIRDLNFQYAIIKTKRFAKGAKENTIVLESDVLTAINYAREKLMDYQGKPVYLPEELAKKGGYYENENKPAKLYSTILEETQQNLEQSNDKN